MTEGNQGKNFKNNTIAKKHNYLRFESQIVLTICDLKRKFLYYF